FLIVIMAIPFVSRGDSASVEPVINPAPYLYITVKQLSGQPQQGAVVEVTLPNGQPHPRNGDVTNENGKVNFSTYGPGTYKVQANYNGTQSGKTTVYVPVDYAYVDVILDTFY
ncbi:MAG: carboxypeptidase-like regulatory domain-containing protein, partial [Ignavibacteria bacterium]|nr:carboxypeptidase-like regulatory domain-containing protein [Ignavibacteria bacterium]